MINNYKVLQDVFTKVGISKVRPNKRLMKEADGGEVH
jgi:hypothetical protein